MELNTDGIASILFFREKQAKGKIFVSFSLLASQPACPGLT
jgi:hypothetical protein